VSEAPKRIWADGNYEWDSGSWGLSKEFDDDIEYIRADLVVAAIKRALEGAVAATILKATRIPADPIFAYHEAIFMAQKAIRALDPAQFIKEPKG